MNNKTYITHDKYHQLLPFHELCTVQHSGDFSGMTTFEKIGNCLECF